MVSIIVPVMNGEKTIHNCLVSLINQTLEDIEIIVVDDGSTDRTAEIVKTFEDDRIRLISRENKGYGYSLNEGFRAAKGDYVGNIDADDLATKDMFKKLYDARIDGDIEYDVVKCGWYNLSNKYILQPQNLPFLGDFEPMALESKWVKSALFCYQPSVWSAIYRKQFLIDNDVWFLETPGASYQDTAFTFKLWLRAKNVLFLGEHLPCYTIDNTLSSVKDKSKVFNICDEFEEIERVCPDDMKSIMAKVRYGCYIWNYLRLNEEGRNLFEPRMISDFEKDLPYVDEELYNNAEWLTYQMVIGGI